MIRFRQSIGFRLLVMSFILLALPLLVDSFILVRQRYQNAISSAEEALLEAAHLKVPPLELLQPMNKPLLEVFANYLKLNDHFPTASQEKLNEELKVLGKIGDFYAILLLNVSDDNKYRVVASSRPEHLGKDYTTFFTLNDLYTPEIKERGYATYFSLNRYSLQPFFIIAYPIFSLKEGRYDGVLVISVDVQTKLVPIMRANTSNVFKIDFALLFPSTIVFAATDPEMKFQYFSPLKPVLKELFLEEEPLASNSLPEKPLPIDTSANTRFFEFTWRGEKQMGYIKQLPNVNFSILTYASKKEISQLPLHEFFSTYSIYALILLVGGAGATLVTMRMAKPMRKLGQVMQKIQAGEVQLRYHKDIVGFEINVLGDIFNKMVQAVLEQKRVAEEERVKKETFTQELLLGQRVQRSLLPQVMPEYPGVEIAEVYIPTIEVGGDFYDVFVKNEKGEQKLVLAIADVSGKGVQACFYSLSVRNMLRTYAKAYHDIAAAMWATDNLFILDTGDTGMFVTVLCGMYDHGTKSLSYYSCGHNPGLVRRVDGSVEILGSTGMAMGVFPSEVGKASTLPLNRGDAVVFYTDGVTEAQNKEGHFFGEERLIECLKEGGSQSASHIVEAIVKGVNTFAEGAPQHDDITLLVMLITL